MVTTAMILDSMLHGKYTSKVAMSDYNSENQVENAWPSTTLGIEELHKCWSKIEVTIPNAYLNIFGFHDFSKN